MLQKLVFVLIMCLAPFSLTVLSIGLVAKSWFVASAYAHPDFPLDKYGFTAAERRQLGLVGLHSITSEAGLKNLSTVRLADGNPAFTDREIAHMADVNILFRTMWKSFLFLMVLLCLLLGVLWTPAKLSIEYMLLACISSALLTLVVLFFLGVSVVFDFDRIFELFHRLFFAPESYVFHETDTLIRLYPGRFWHNATVYVGLIMALGASLLIILSLCIRWILKRKQGHIQPL